ncbi:hypothetical protein [Aegicerativicinus sediminis]|uniref:hypothetical protein n=1 Tax=Aegicerativicinus sediminis TaxID=2893202 RepID=UPI001E5E13CC|nr:hypothetical protein [Aegicerativicinus sediminis]
MKTIKSIFSLKPFLVFIFSVLIVSCSDDDTPNKVRYTDKPGKPNLLIPSNNEECEVGEVFDDTAIVTFNWDASSDTEKYNFEITNLITGNVILNIGSPTNSLQVELLRGYPYSWTVTARNSGQEITESDTWKFYLAGDGESNFVPFPASLLSPSQGSDVTPSDGKVTLEWISSDADGDEVTYTVFADSVDGNQEVPEEWQGISETSLDIDVEPNTIYYWHVETSDGINISVSPTYTFKTTSD